MSCSSVPTGGGVGVDGHARGGEGGGERAGEGGAAAQVREEGRVGVGERGEVAVGAREVGRRQAEEPGSLPWSEARRRTSRRESNERRRSASGNATQTNAVCSSERVTSPARRCARK